MKSFRESEYLICVDNDDLIFVFNIDGLDLEKPASFRPLLILKYSPFNLKKHLP